MNQQLNISQESPRANRQYKDRLFRLVFSKKEDLLSLYNAVNGTGYSEPDALEINTLENVLYLSMKNDISFLISGTMNLYEHQSTYNPNMPIRGLMYLATLYEKYIARNEIDIYTSTPKQLPFPQYLVFYNGTQEEPDRRVLCLSDLFVHPPKGRTPCLECIAVMLNINYGHNKELMEKCRRLEEYAIFIHTVREKYDSGLSQAAAIRQSIIECRQKHILEDILTDQQAEVEHMLLETFDKELHEKTLRKEGYSEGYDSGYDNGRENGILLLIQTLQELDLTAEDILRQLMEKYELNREEAEAYLKKTN